MESKRNWVLVMLFEPRFKPEDLVLVFHVHKSIKLVFLWEELSQSD